MFIPELNFECDLLSCYKEDGCGELKIISPELEYKVKEFTKEDICGIYFAPDADAAPVGIVVEYIPYDDRDPWLCFSVILTEAEIEHFHIEPWQLEIT